MVPLPSKLGRYKKGARRGMLYRPVKQPLSLRLDADVVARFKDAGDGYQTRINRALREYVENHSKRA
ncbi:BrnA antitoxin family protein [Asticcacaulis sp. EMRT-3]|uniref:BrnA antitoxin family protein n=1 Tax=Asticcacaulis sp. EMRT-3 TaxID=3040349 RepID=UPI0024AF0ECD|nr:BrnA antitoxin family protein [Asticcacaulis sp. EMRT-3]MDI7775310.1 BrnA antitoxin family protein [Asticcacaulis sp. EMRT-3]